MVEAKKALDLVQGKLFAWVEALVVMLPNMALATLIVLAFWLLARLARHLLGRVLGRVLQSATL